jgi:hypothetical protein
MRYGVWLSFLWLAAPLRGETSTAPVTVSSPTESAALPSGMNQITGTVSSVDTDAKVLRLSVQGGISVEFPYHADTKIVDHGKPLSADALEYGDRVAVRYAGMALDARQIERIESAPRAIPLESVPSDTASPVAP